MKLFGTMEIKNNKLYIGQVNCEDLVEEYNTPLYVIDEEFLRENCKRYYKAFGVEKYGNKVAYAGKAFLTIGMCQIINQEGLYLDVVSGGELYTAYKAVFPMEKIYFHGNNKTDEEIQMGVKLGVGKFVVDNFYEMERINELAKERGLKQDILLRVTPGIEAHTHEYIKTGQLDSKFGFSVIGNEIFNAIDEALKLSSINLSGIHCHIGSQIFDITPYKDEVDIMLNLIKEIEKRNNYTIEELDLGGGFGIYYKEGDSPKTTEEYCNIILKSAFEKAKELDMKLPTLVIEPGRSIVGNTAVTLYRIGAIKDIPNIRKYIAVDGGMTDNIRPALYNAEYECGIANKMKENIFETVTVAGKCCESGDILIENVELPQVEGRDILVVFSTGAYGYSMANNYNKIPKSAVVLVRNGESKVLCKRENFEDLIRNELNI